MKNYNDKELNEIHNLEDEMFDDAARNNSMLAESMFTGTRGSGKTEYMRDKIKAISEEQYSKMKAERDELVNGGFLGNSSLEKSRFGGVEIYGDTIGTFAKAYESYKKADCESEKETPKKIKKRLKVSDLIAEMDKSDNDELSE